MGSMIHLAIGRLEIDWGKNRGFHDYSALFQGEADVADVPYYYAGEENGVDFEGNPKWDTFIERKEGLSKPLAQVIDRLELLGHTYEQCEREFQFFSGLNGFDSNLFSFEELRDALANVDVETISADFDEGGEDFGTFFRRELLPCLGLKDHFEAASYEVHSVSGALEDLSAYTILHLLSLNPNACELPVQWAFYDIEQGGYARRDEFVRQLEPANRFLIVTEGSSDAAILRHAFETLRPHIADFFVFVDMAEGYPFSGTGNVFRFVQGLISISVLNNILVLFDNDAEGVFNYERCKELNIPHNMRILKLPDLPDFREFPTVGPNGQHAADINGCGAAIECYLDLDANARVRWTGYNAKAKAYQGELESKTDHARNFLKRRKRSSSYDYSRIECILNMLTDSAIEIREKDVTKEWDLVFEN